MKSQTLSSATVDERFEITKLTDYLYLSGYEPISLNNLRRLDITCVVNCIKGVDHALPSSIDYVKVAINDDDSEDIAAYFDSCNSVSVCVHICACKQGTLQVIERHRAANGRVLVYCGLGISRSATICIAHLMQVIMLVGQ